LTFKDLRKRFSSQWQQKQQEQQDQQSNLALLSNRLKNKPFWIWDIPEHKRQNIITNGDCCFNHMVGCPEKNGIQKPMFDYERIVFEALQSHNHLWIKKATGLVVTEFFLRFIAWLCLKNDGLSDDFTTS